MFPNGAVCMNHHGSLALCVVAVHTCHHQVSVMHYISLKLFAEIPAHRFFFFKPSPFLHLVSQHDRPVFPLLSVSLSAEVKC